MDLRARPEDGMTKNEIRATLLAAREPVRMPIPDHELAALRASNNELKALVDQSYLRAENGRLRKENGRLQQRIADLEKELDFT